jgi:hypothetical protein
MPCTSQSFWLALCHFWPVPVTFGHFLPLSVTLSPSLAYSAQCGTHAYFLLESDTCEFGVRAAAPMMSLCNPCTRQKPPASRSYSVTFGRPQSRFGPSGILCVASFWRNTRPSTPDQAEPNGKWLEEGRVSVLAPAEHYKLDRLPDPVGLTSRRNRKETGSRNYCAFSRSINLRGWIGFAISSNSKPCL